MQIITRRHFIKSSALVVGAYATHRSFGSDVNSEVRLAIVGLHWRGTQLIEDLMRTQGTRLVALCDVDSAVLAKTAEKVKTDYNIDVDQVIEYRELLERDDIDAVVIATPNHWHALQTIWACQAGKDIYLEKPICHTIWEGKRIIEAAKKYGRIVQCGLQNRSDIGLKEAFAWIKEGNIGAIKKVSGLCFKNRASIGKRETPLVPPETVDYNLWLGPAADEPLFRDKLHYDWHWMWNTGNGDIGNQGTHEFDLIRWILGDPDHPQDVFSMGGRFAWDDAGETPNMQVASVRWPEQEALFEVRDMWANPETDGAAHYKGYRIGVFVTCEGGEFRGGRGGGIVYDENNEKKERFKGDGGFDHFPSFIRAVNSRKESDLASPLEQGFKSTVVPLLCNISHQMGKAQSSKRAARGASQDANFNEVYKRIQEHLGIWNIDTDEDRWTIGSKLRFDAASERFTSGPRVKQANGKLRRGYRNGFEVPESV